MIDNDGDDIIDGENGADIIYGVAGSDRLKGSEGNDRINHNSLLDSTSQDGGADKITCGSGDVDASISNEEDAFTATCETICPR